ncbi:hypothetical protein K0M31_007166 [Melipona bicolor]|uniref:Uncharacterized protein n=1 Tax=Melipona bicolor TaxID=60889 RepID=A0AA40FSM7_9HYME|nr:hypothetical protein K0M31_007166 [Melipona bicolor]
MEKFVLYYLNLFCSGEFPCYNTHCLGAGTSGKVYEFLSALSRLVSPENPSHLAELCSEQTRPSTVDWSMEPTFPNTCQTQARKITQDGNQQLLADEVSHEDTIADGPRLNVAENHLQGSHSRKDDCSIKARNRRFSAGHNPQSTRPAFPSPIAIFVR